jgi:hypothetical protein
MRLTASSTNPARFIYIYDIMDNEVGYINYIWPKLNLDEIFIYSGLIYLIRNIFD